MQEDKPPSIDLLNKYRDFENIAARAGVRPELIKDVKKEVTEKIGQTESVIEKRLAGLGVEDEFMLMALILGNVEQLTPLGQKQYVNWKKYGIPDYLMSVLVPEEIAAKKEKMVQVQRLFVEVKKAKENQADFVVPFEILTKLRTFCKLYGLPLYFALKMNPFGLRQWLLISDVSVDRLGKRISAKVRGREEDCVSISMLDLVKEDFSGLWLSNYAVFIPEGLMIRKKYRDLCDGVITSPEYGKLAEVEVSFAGAKKLVIEMKNGMPGEQLLLHAVVEKLRVGDRRVEKLPEGTDVVYETKVNYFMGFYSIMLETYLDLREQYEPIIMKTPNPTPNIGYFLQVFDEFDRNLTASLRSAIWELHYRGLVLPIRMMPNRKTK